MSTEEMAASGRQFHIPLTEPIDGPDVELPINPYIMGLWLGNGNNYTGELYIRTEFFDNTLKEVQNIHPSASAGRFLPGIQVISLGGTGVRTSLNNLGLIQNKSLPELFLRGSLKQRLALLQGLMDTDGSINSEGTCTFSNTLEDVVDAVAEIVRSLGLVASKNLTTDDRIGANGPHKPCWKVIFHPRPSISPFRSRDISIQESVWTSQNLIHSIVPVSPVPVRCITVDNPDHLFLAGRNMSITHNCFKASSALLNTLLPILNERMFYNGSPDSNIPLSTMICASNETPESATELAALWDRLFFRVNTKRIQNPSNFDGMLRAAAQRFAVKNMTEPVISWADITQAQAEVRRVQIPDDVYDAMADLWGSLSKEKAAWVAGHFRF